MTEAEVAKFASGIAEYLGESDVDRMLAKLDDWEHIGRVHDWRNHVPEVVVDAWDSLPIEAKLVAFATAESEAQAEQWE
jgi:hypothetical protein